MARKKREKGDYDLDINMTPMIDVVFNLIIFFMVITDMSQKDLEYLILPRAENAVEDDGQEKNRIILNVVNMQRYIDNKWEINPGWPPIFIEGRQIESLDSLRTLLRARADPTQPRNQDRDKPQIAPGVYPSNVPLLVRCDQGQIFGWVQVLMQLVTIMPNESMAQAIARSPLIHKLEIAVAEKDQPRR